MNDRLEIKESTPYTPGFELPAIKKNIEKPEKENNGPAVYVEKIKFTGNTVIEDTELEGLVKPYLNVKITQKHLSEIRNNITSYYVNKGYINSGAYLPDQDLSKSILLVAIIEGKLSKINITTKGRLSKENINEKLGVTSETILDINYLKKRLYILQQDVLIDRVNARLQPTDKRGLAELILEITEADPIDLTVLLNNYRPPSVGEFQGVITVTHLNISGEGDAGFISASQTEGLSSIDLSYDYPILPGKFTLGFGANGNKSDVIEEPFSLIDIENSSYSWAILARYKYHKTLNEEINLFFTLESKVSKTTIGDISFNLNDVNAEQTRASIFRFSQEWFSRNIKQSYALRSTFSYGFDANNATILDNGADGEYLSWLGQLQWLRRLNKNHSASVQFITQLSNDALLPFEQYAAGGRYSVRGFRENAFIRDMGLTLNLGYKIPYQIRRFYHPLNFIVFSDMTLLRNKDRLIDSKESMASIGLGLQGEFSNNTGYEIMWAHAAEKQKVNDNTLQDDGVHLQVYIRY